MPRTQFPKPIQPSRLCVFTKSDRPADCARRCFIPRCIQHKAILTETAQAGGLFLVGAAPTHESRSRP